MSKRIGRTDRHHEKGTHHMTRSWLHRASRPGRRDDRGATAVEYGLIVALIAIVIIVAVALLGRNLKGTFNTVASSVTMVPVSVTAFIDDVR
jgi:pilus assembly protein Flp/PilA